MTRLTNIYEVSRTNFNNLNITPFSVCDILKKKSHSSSFKDCPLRVITWQNFVKYNNTPFSWLQLMHTSLGNDLKLSQGFAYLILYTEYSLEVNTELVELTKWSQTVLSFCVSTMMYMNKPWLILLCGSAFWL